MKQSVQFKYWKCYTCTNNIVDDLLQIQYEDAPKNVAESIANSSKRVQDKKKADIEIKQQEEYVDVEKEKHSQLIGQLK